MIQMVMNLLKKPQPVADIPRDRLVRALLSPEERRIAREWMGQPNPYRFRRCN